MLSAGRAAAGGGLGGAVATGGGELVGYCGGGGGDWDCVIGLVPNCTPGGDHAAEARGWLKSGVCASCGNAAWAGGSARGGMLWGIKALRGGSVTDAVGWGDSLAIDGSRIVGDWVAGAFTATAPGCRIVLAADEWALAPSSTIRGADAFNEACNACVGGLPVSIAGNSGLRTSNGFAPVGVMSGRGTSLA